MAEKQKRIQQMTFAEWEKAFPDEDACDAYLVAHRWPKGVYCPRCGSVKVYPLTTRKWHWECPDCRQGGAYRFSDITGTIFENTNKDLLDWFRVIHLMLTAKKGIAALQVQRMMGFGSYKTAWFMCMRVRAAMQDKEFKKLMGIVEVDETFVGGKRGNWPKGKQRPRYRRGEKAIVAGAVSRKGNVVARVIDNVQQPTLQRFVRETVSDRVSLIVTDAHKGYAKLRKEFPAHYSVDHAAGEYAIRDEVIGAIHTNTIEGFWSLIKRGIMGNYHKVSRKYLPLYVAEFCFRYNNRANEDIFAEAIAGC